LNHLQQGFVPVCFFQTKYVGDIMGVIDWIILAVLLIMAGMGFRKGLAGSLLQICGTIAIFFLVGHFYPLARNGLSQNFKLSGFLATLVAIVLIGVLLFVVLRILIWLINRLISVANLSFANKLLGLLFGLANGLLVVIVAMVMLDYLPRLSTPLKNPAQHRIYAAVDTLKEDLFQQLKLKQRDKYLDLLHKLRKDKDTPPATR